VAALEHSGPAIYNIVDDEPAPMRDWLSWPSGSDARHSVLTWVASV
jgi:hypothetical protein